MILRETLGISADGSLKAYRMDDIDAFLARKAMVIPWQPNNPHTVCNYNPTHGPPEYVECVSVPG
jgi:hypothetical protein